MTKDTASMEENTINFAKIAKIIIEVAGYILQDILAAYTNPLTLVHGTDILNEKQQNSFDNIPDIGNFSACDLSTLYILCKNNLSPLFEPSSGWEAFSSLEEINENDQLPGDDIERFKLWQLKLSSLSEPRLSTITYRSWFNDLKVIISRFDDSHGRYVHSFVYLFYH